MSELIKVLRELLMYVEASRLPYEVWAAIMAYTDPHLLPTNHPDYWNG